MDPVRFVNKSEQFTTLHDSLNLILAFSGLSLGTDGKLRSTAPVRTLAEAEERAGRLKAELSRRVHHDVLKFYKPELLQEKRRFHPAQNPCFQMTHKCLNWRRRNSLILLPTNRCFSEPTAFWVSVRLLKRCRQFDSQGRNRKTRPASFGVCYVHDKALPSESLGLYNLSAWGMPFSSNRGHRSPASPRCA